ncbi:MAG: T9SS type A sorting domain-containing protein [Candidatus Marinimicrobia bacterium]|nr:T9SS type A sorting domain-containing protein [Candidatus Neomarinimicrobiota bacterium]MBT4178178.1 T9SS type A sorting domain-containing protein [Candidatus Neomarinimicrobiota bacterium]MBT4991136.1 T9SS type A sorting domain-containing protein [Candidatus Neomarinimicrobiota bacterium]
MKKTLFAIITIFGFIHAQYKYEELLFVPWGFDEEKIALREVPGFRIGPQFFSVSNGEIQIMDLNAQTQKIYEHQALKRLETLDPKDSQKSIKIADMVSVIRTDDEILQIVGNDFAFSIIQAEGFASGKYLGKNGENNHYVYIETILQHVPLRVKREIALFDLTGKRQATFPIPNVDYTFIEFPFHVDELGDLYIMSTRKTGVTISVWKQDERVRNKGEASIFHLPNYLQEGKHFNQSPNLFPEAEPLDDERESFIYPPVTPAEALEMAETYVTHEWSASSGNITGGAIVDPNGVIVETPGWVQLGTNYHVPYQWGGFYTIDGFDNGISAGKYAGDKATSCDESYCVSAYARGVDCSGFISRCWNLDAHYSTSMMDDGLTIFYDNWNDLSPGDAIHKVGHVRMLVLRNADGTFLVVESSAYDWKVSYRTYNLSQLTDYTPRYYVGMEGGPATIPRTETNAIVWSDSISITWHTQDPDSISGFNLYSQSTDNLWTLLSEMNASESEIMLSNGNENPLFYKLTSVSNLESISESFASDIYGVYQSDETENILIVDGFDRMNGSYPFPYHDFAKRMGQALIPWGYAFDTADNDAVISGEIQLSHYTAVFWLLGDESTEHETFSASEQNIVKDYLKQGGQIFISGSEVAWDLDQQGSSSDRNFLHDYLKTQYNLDDANSYIAHGAEGTVFESLTLYYDNGNYGVYPENYPDAFSTTGGSESALIYGNNLIAGIQFSGLVPGGTENARIVMMGFPFETIYAEQERIDLAGRILAFFGFSVELGFDDVTIQANQFRLYPNFPNPFNPSTTIRFSVEMRQTISLRILDVKGRLVKNLLEEAVEPGLHEIQWNASQMASGVYFVEMLAGSFRDVQKMILLK